MIIKSIKSIIKGHIPIMNIKSMSFSFFFRFVLDIIFPKINSKTFKIHCMTVNKIIKSASIFIVNFKQISAFIIVNMFRYSKGEI